MTVAHDELYVVSDLHLGDAPERSIFQDTDRLAATIRGLAARAPERDVALVLAGDVVDFLAQEPARRFDPAGASAKLATIIGNYRPVFEALRAFTAQPRRRLVVLVGNHDVELALPHVTAQLVEAMCADEASRGRVLLALDGVGYRCAVGGRSVFVVHGNEVDTWNVVDHEAVRRVGAALLRGLEAPVWEANPGSALVVEVMNPVKAEHPFVDMLKPEDAGLAGVLMALDPSVVARLAKLPTVAARGPVAWLKQRGWLSAERVAVAQPAVEGAAPRVARAGAVSAEALIGAALGEVRSGKRPTDLLTEEGTLGWAGAIGSRLAGRPDVEALRDAMQRWLERTRYTFDLRYEDDTAKALAQLVGPEVDVVIAGHTHIRRAQVRVVREGDAPGWYFNSGTWITMFDVPAAMLADEGSFEPLWRALQHKTPRELLAMRPCVVRRMATVVRVTHEGDAVIGALCEPDETGAALREVPRARCELPVRG